jgi:hypothetical protein
VILMRVMAANGLWHLYCPFMCACWFQIDLCARRRTCKLQKVCQAAHRWHCHRGNCFAQQFAPLLCGVGVAVHRDHRRRCLWKSPSGTRSGV